MKVAGAIILLAFLVFATLGCKTKSPSQYVSPKVVGRVLDAKSRQPIKDAKVQRERADTDYRPMDPVHGGQRMEINPFVLTADDGRFVLDSVRDIAFIRSLGWFSVSVSFTHGAYRPLSVTYTPSDATNSASGEPVVNAGDLLLTPLGQ